MSETTESTQQQEQEQERPVDLNETLADLISSLTPEQEQKKQQLREIIETKFLVENLSPAQQRAYKTTRSIFLVRHLIARKWIVDDALAMIKLAAEWRIKNKIDELVIFPSLSVIRGYDQKVLQEIRGHAGKDREIPEEENKICLDKCCEQLHKVYSCCWHKSDKHGRPVFIERTGSSKSRGIVEVFKNFSAPGEKFTDLAISLHIRSNEVGATLLLHNNIKGVAKSLVSGATVIMDVGGLNKSHFYGAGLEIMKLQSELDQSVLAEGCHKIFVVNCPTIVTMFWSMISLWINERSRAKVFFIKPQHTKETLLEAIAAENLPKWLGGECECEGGCCPEVPGPPEELNLTFEGGTKEVNIKAGSVEKHETEEVTAGDDVHYHVHIPDHDVIVGVQFHPSPATGTTSTKAPEPIVIKEPTKMQGEIKEKFSSPTTGKLVVSFDNSHSWLRSKTVAVNTKVDPTAKKEEEEQEASSSAAAASS